MSLPPFGILIPAGKITPGWFKALALRLSDSDDEAEQKARMAIERRTELELRRALNDMKLTLFPEGWDTDFPAGEAERIHRAFLEEQKLRDDISRALQDSVDLGVSVAVKQLEGVGYGFDYTLANVRARDWALRYTDTLLNQLGTTSGRVVGQAVGRWINNGEGLPALINDLEPVFGKKLAATVATTEVTRAYAQGSVEGYRESGLVKELVWRASIDEFVCPYCGGLNGKVVGIDASFSDALPEELKGKITPFALPPAHPNCILPGNLVSAPGGIDAMAKSFYVGECVEITLSDGCSLAVTKNHPILTPGGWVAAQFLSEGMNVFSAIGGDRIASAINPNNQNVPTAIEKVFDSFVKSGDVASISVPPAAEHLHGEGDSLKGNIDIVYANRLLLSNGVSKGTEIGGEDAFGENAAGLGSLPGLGASGSLVSGHRTPPDGGVGIDEHGVSPSIVGLCPACRHSIGAIPRGDTRFNQATTEHLPSAAHLSTEGLLGLAGEIANDIGVNVLDVDTSTAQGDIGGLESPVDDLVTADDLVGKFLDRFASEITINQITNIREFDFSGHVYDLQSDMYELYICNGVIVKNCRCFLLPRVAEPKRKR